MMELPLVSVVCLCYNQQRFVKEAVESVINQTYQNIELIVLDDGSTDGSQSVIRALVDKYPAIKFISHSINQGYCKTLNEAMDIASGEFIIDLAADDVLLPLRVEVGVNYLIERGSAYGVHFSDAEMINESGVRLSAHSDRFPHSSIPQGDVYLNLIDRYFICPPSLMFRKSVVEAIGRYDESLAFEDFDFLIRSSRQFYFCYSPIPLVKKRIVSTSMSSKQFVIGSDQRWSTLKVCKKINMLNKTAQEHRALKRRARYEFLVCVKLLDIKLALAFLKFYFRLSPPKTMLT